ncbi:NAD(P)H-hydrate dehydratase [Aureimonas sp. AU22]|uniref:NAD(P)H-hydrate dehydratase n=1 Tax=Aureimonas sp. AU22 TaxID=1638162 RepID=UPI0007867542|nr:NAD(P)H-hydrate dehydratase [Aureimonas sp. AU22]
MTIEVPFEPPIAVTASFLRGHPLPDPGEATDKGERGTILIVAGNARTPGTALLAGTAALRVGAGKLQIATARSTAPHVATAMPEALVVGLAETADGEIDPGDAAQLTSLAASAHAIVVGPGFLDEDGAAKLACALFDAAPDARFLVDAGALTGLRNQREALQALRGRLVITPHAGEMATFLGISKDEVTADPRAAGHRAASTCDAVVVMKGGDTHICLADGTASQCEGGGVGLATSGSGDVLAGVIGGLLARGAPPLMAARWGTHLHAEAGRQLARTRGRLGFLARELTDVLPTLL